MCGQRCHVGMPEAPGRAGGTSLGALQWTLLTGLGACVQVTPRPVRSRQAIRGDERPQRNWSLHAPPVFIPCLSRSRGAAWAAELVIKTHHPFCPISVIIMSSLLCLLPGFSQGRLSVNPCDLHLGNRGAQRPPNWFRLHLPAVHPLYHFPSPHPLLLWTRSLEEGLALLLQGHSPLINFPLLFFSVVSFFLP